MTSASLNAPLRHAAKLAEGEQIALDALHMRALRRREIKEKEAFTIVDREGHFFRASLKVMKKSGGEALVYAAPSAARAGLRIVFAAGPEGGWNDAERAMLERRGALPLRLGGRVLRAETAVLAGLTLLQHAYGDM